MALSRAWRKLIEIRLRRSDKVVYEVFPDQIDQRWIPDTPRQRARLGQAVARANRLYGHPTHWIEERQA